MTRKPTIAELENMMAKGQYVEITPSGEVNVNPVEHVLEDVLRISELEKENKRLREANIAPTDNGIKELDDLCQSYNNGDINLSRLVCSSWNKALMQSPDVKKGSKSV